MIKNLVICVLLSAGSLGAMEKSTQPACAASASAARECRCEEYRRAIRHVEKAHSLLERIDVHGCAHLQQPIEADIPEEDQYLSDLGIEPFPKEPELVAVWGSWVMGQSE